MENDVQQPQEIPQTPEIPQEQIPVQQENKSPKSLIITLVIASVLIAGYFVSAKFLFNTWPFSETVVETPMPIPEANKRTIRDARRVTDLNQLRSALSLYFEDEGVYPMSLNDELLIRHIIVIPKDPLNGKSYNYAVNSDRSNFHLWTELENKLGGLTADSDDDSSGFIGSPIDASLPSTEACNTIELGDNDCIYDLSSNLIELSRQRNTQRWKDVNILLNAIRDRMKDSSGTWLLSNECSGFPDSYTAIGTAPGSVDLAKCLVPRYLTEMIIDPSEGMAESTGYEIYQSTEGRIFIRAPHGELDEVISVALEPKLL